MTLCSFITTYKTICLYQADSTRRSLYAHETRVRVLGSRVFGAVDAVSCVCIDDTSTRMKRVQARLNRYKRAYKKVEQQKGRFTLSALPYPCRALVAIVLSCFTSDYSAYTRNRGAFHAQPVCVGYKCCFQISYPICAYKIRRVSQINASLQWLYSDAVTKTSKYLQINNVT